jgi:uncharacterized protein (TIGR02246 family)
MKKLTLVLFVFFVFPAEMRAAEYSPDETAVEALSERFVSAWNSHDATRIGALFTENADFVNYVGIWWKNQTDIVNGHEQVLTTFLSKSILRRVESSVRIIDQNTALLRWKWELEGQIDPVSGKALPIRSGLLLFVVQKKLGDWKVIAAQNTDILPKPQLLNPDGSRKK